MPALSPDIFPRLDSTSLRDNIGSSIRQAIMDGYFPPGSRLPTEQQLAMQMGVGRSSVREAVEHLVAIGLVERRRGLGVFVSGAQARTEGIVAALVPTLMLDQPSLQWLLEVRQTVEPRVAAMAARRATEEDLRELAAVVRRLEEQRSEPEAYAHTDLEYHLRIAQASGNRLFPHIIEGIHALFAHELLITVRVAGAISRSLPYHLRIFEALRARDAAAAEDLMAEHLTDVEQQLIELEMRRAAQAQPDQTDEIRAGGEPCPSIPKAHPLA